jgi:hypothetical protein
MPRRQLSTGGIVLDKEDTGENFLRYQVLSPEHGLLLCLKRKAAKASAKTRPDFFDCGAFELEQPAQSQSWFIREFILRRRHDAIAANYEAFRRAAEFSKILCKNLMHA